MCNIGDSRAVIREKDGITTTKDHKLNNPVEQQKRIMELGGNVYEKNGVWRVTGGLAMSRAIGDSTDRPLVSGEPDFMWFPIEAVATVTLATDGVWDKVKNEEALLDKDGYAQSLVDRAVSRGTTWTIAPQLWLTSRKKRMRSPVMIRSDGYPSI